MLRNVVTISVSPLRSSFSSNGLHTSANRFAHSAQPSTILVSIPKRYFSDYNRPPSNKPPQHTTPPITPNVHTAPYSNVTTPPPAAKKPVHAPSTFEIFKPRITVVGVGGAGGNAINHMITGQLEGVDFMVCNTDAQALSQSLCVKRVQLGAHLTSGLGAGAKPDIGRRAAEESIGEIVDHLKDSHLVFLAAGMGGGTGTGATPLIAKALKEFDKDILTVAVVTKPFNFEGKYRRNLAQEGLNELAQHVDTMIVISNQKLLSVSNENTKFTDAFRYADEILHGGVRTITDLMVVPGMINLDYSDVKAILCDMRGAAMMGVGEATGEGRAIKAAKQAIHNPLLDTEETLKGAKGVLINITGGPDVTLHEVDAAASMIQGEADPDANIIFGQCLDNEMHGSIRVSVVCAK